MNSNELEKKLKNLYIHYKILRMELDISCNDDKKRNQTFNKIKELKKEIENVKFKIKIVKEMKKNANNNTDCSKK